MNTEALQDQAVTMTTGARLRQAREQMGLSQQAVAERLCLKVSTVREIEEDKANPNLASTFLRGYIRSYARLVHISEDELLPMLAKQAPIKVAKVAQMKGFSLGKTRKKRDGWLMGFTWLILLVVIGLTGAWWWQNHQAQQQDITDMADQSSSRLTTGTDGDGASGGAQNGGDNAAADDVGQPPADQPSEADSHPVPINNPQAASQSASPVVSPSAPASATATTTTSAPADPAPAPQDSTAPAPADAGANNGLMLNFTADCWLEVLDANGKKLFSGTQRNGGKLNLAGQAPFKLKIGAPAAVQIEYQGKPVDLSRYVRSNQVARITIAAN